MKIKALNNTWTPTAATGFNPKETLDYQCMIQEFSRKWGLKLRNINQAL